MLRDVLVQTFRRAPSDLMRSPPLPAPRRRRGHVRMLAAVSALAGAAVCFGIRLWPMARLAASHAGEKKNAVEARRCGAVVIRRSSYLYWPPMRIAHMDRSVQTPLRHLRRPRSRTPIRQPWPVSVRAVDTRCVRLSTMVAPPIRDTPRPRPRTRGRLVYTRRPFDCTRLLPVPAVAS